MTIFALVKLGALTNITVIDITFGLVLLLILFLGIRYENYKK
tara:strand:+ start:1310 stop:1435 length:126 start_codon:yes stop_codon:yes gene_type:complete